MEINQEILTIKAFVIMIIIIVTSAYIFNEE